MNNRITIERLDGTIHELVTYMIYSDAYVMAVKLARAEFNANFEIKKFEFEDYNRIYIKETPVKKHVEVLAYKDWRSLAACKSIVEYAVEQSSGSKVTATGNDGIYLYFFILEDDNTVTVAREKM